jgi:hypothetical protein
LQPFATNYPTLVANSHTDAAVENYTTRIATVTSIDDFPAIERMTTMSDNDELPELWEWRLRSYGIEPRQRFEKRTQENS